MPRSWRWTLRRAALVELRVLAALQVVALACFVGFAVARSGLPDEFAIFLVGKRRSGEYLMPADLALIVSAVSCAISLLTLTAVSIWLVRSAQELVRREVVNSCAVVCVLGPCATIGLGVTALSGWSFAALVVVAAGATSYVMLEGLRRRLDNRWLLGARLDEIAAARQRAGLAPYGS